MRASMIFYKILSFLFIGGSLLCLAIFGILDSAKDGWMARHLFMVICFSAVPLYLGFHFNKKVKKMKQSQLSQMRNDKDTRLEKQLIQLAARHPNGITISDAAMNIRDSIEHIEAAMRNLQENRVFEVKIAENGVLIYRLLSASHSDKENASSVI